MAEWMEETSAPCNRVQPNIGMHILRAVLFTFPKVLTWRIYLAIKSLISWRSFPLQFTVTQGGYCEENYMLVSPRIQRVKSHAHV